MDAPILTALAIGFLGSTHCVGMCGGIVTALHGGLSPAVGQGAGTRPMTFHLAYNTGRITSYAFAGAVAGLAGQQAAKIPLNTVLPLGGLIAGLFMIALGLYLVGWRRAIAVLENAGRHLWRHVEPLGRRFLPVRSPAQAFGLGLVWGWLPCGLVYSALALALVSGTPGRGAVLMAVFGLGTLPMLLVVGKAYAVLREGANHPTLRRLAGAAIIAVGAYMSVQAVIGHHGHDSHAGHTTSAGTETPQVASRPVD